MINIQAGPAFMSELKSSIWGLYEDSLENPQAVSGKVVIEVFQAIDQQKAEKTGRLIVTVPQAEYILHEITYHLDKWVEWAQEDIRAGHLVKSAYRLKDFLVSELREKR